MTSDRSRRARRAMPVLLLGCVLIAVGVLVKVDWIGVAGIGAGLGLVIEGAHLFVRGRRLGEESAS